MGSFYNIGFASKKQQKLIARILLLCSILLFILVLLWGLYFTVYGLYKERKKVNRSHVEISVAPKKNIYSLERTVQQNLFGKKPKVVVNKPKPKPAPVRKVTPETKLDLALQGLLSAENQVTARAIISVKKKPGKLYKVGEELEGAKGVTIEEIKPNGVLINRNGQLENLTLVRKTTKGNLPIISFGNEVPSVYSPEARVTPNQINTPINRSRVNTRSNQTTTSGRRKIKRPSSNQFKGLDKGIERELERSLELPAF